VLGDYDLEKRLAQKPLEDMEWRVAEMQEHKLFTNWWIYLHKESLQGDGQCQYSIELLRRVLKITYLQCITVTLLGHSVEIGPSIFRELSRNSRN
jgi:hypothetical protein